MAAVILFGAVSCAKEDISSSLAGGEVEVTFTANLPELGTRAYGDGANAGILFYNIYEANTENKLDALCGSVESGTNTFKFQVPMIKGMTYDIVLWAQNKDCGYYRLDGKQVTAVYAGKNANDDTRDAFYCFKEDFSPTAPAVVIPLTRPFAQLNVATSDLNLVAKSGVQITTTTVKVKTYTGFNIATGDVTGEQSEITFEATNAPFKAGETLKTGYDYLSMNYLLVPKEGMTVDPVYTFNNNKGVVFENTSYGNVPLKQNYRTNILGALLTKQTEIEVEILPGFGDPDQDYVMTAADLKEQIENAPAGEQTEIVLGGDIDLNDLLAGLLETRAGSAMGLTIPEGKSIVLNLSGYTLSCVDDTDKSFAVITNKGELTITDTSADADGKITLESKINSGWGRYSSVISNTVGGKLIVNAGIIEHLGGTDMAYGIDNLTNGKGTTAVAEINGGTVKSPYRAIRQFLNGTEANNSLTVNGGVIEGTNKSIWMQDPSAHANSGSLVVAANAQLKGDVFLSVTAGSTEWPVSASVAAAALQGESTVLVNDNVPAGYNLELVDGIWTINYTAAAKIGEEEYNSLQAAIEAVQDGETIVLQRDLHITTPAYGQNALNHAKAVNFTLNLNGKTLSADTGNSLFRFNITQTEATSDVVITIKNGTVTAGDNTWCALMATGISKDAKAIMNIEDVVVNNSKGGDLAIKAWDYALINAKNVTVNSTNSAGGFYAVGGEIVLDNCIANQKGLYTAPYLSMAIAVSNNGKLTVNSGTYTTEPTAAEEGYNQGTSHGTWCAGVMNSGGELIINGGTFANGNFGDDALATAARGLIFGDTASKIVINDGVFNALKTIIDYQNNLGVQPNPNIVINGGDFSANPAVVTSYGGVVFAEGKAPVQGDNGRWTLQDAVTTEAGLKEALVAGGNIILGANITLAETAVIAEGATVVLDLNGKTLAHADEENKYAIDNHGTLTIKGNGTVNARGIYNGYNNGSNIATAKLTIENGTFNAKGTNGGAAIFNYGVAEINGGNFTSIGGYSLNNQVGASMTIADGVKANNGIYNSGATLTINGGEIEGNRSGCHVVYAWNATVTINGGSIHNNNSGNSTLMAAGTTKMTVKGGTFSIQDGRIPGNNNTWTSCLTDTQNSAELTVNGGTFNGGFRVQAGTTMNINGGSFNDCTGSAYNIYGTAVVKGGKFTDDAAKNFATKYLADGFELNPNGEVVAK